MNTRNFFVIGIILSVLFMAGCIQQNNVPSVTQLSVDKAYVFPAEQVRIGYYIQNPLSAAFEGSVKYTYDRTCFSGTDSTSVKVPSSVSVAYSADFKLSDSYSFSESCYGPKQITLVLTDSTGKPLYAATADFTVAKH